KGEARTKKLNDLAMDSQLRKELFSKLAQTWDQIQTIKAAHDSSKAAQQAELEDQYEQLKSQIDQINLTVSDLEAVLDSYTDAKKRDTALIGLKAKFKDFPSRVAA